MNTNSETSLKKAGHLYVKGYNEDRVNNGDTRVYSYPKSPLPNLPDTEFPDLEPSFVTAQKLKHQN